MTTSLSKTKTVTASFKYDNVIRLPNSWYNQPHQSSLKYFIPDWDDQVDPDYDFQTETHSGGRGNWSNQVYAHQMYPTPNYDGILVSRVVAEKTEKKKERINEMGVHRYLRVPPEFEVMGDCGAFDYIKKDVPPYNTNEILEYYSRLTFDYGVSIDHLILADQTEDQQKFRYDLTIQNAEDFLVEHAKRGLPWTPIGAVQGWDPQSYANAARQYVEMGYQYIALGGMVRTKTPEILAVLEEVKTVVPSDVKIHIFGVARPDAFLPFSKLGVHSVDSASTLRTAWLGSNRNYLSPQGWYSAIRVPQTDASFRAKRLISDGVVSKKYLQSLEERCLKSLWAYGADSTNVPSSLLDDLVEYDTLIAGERQKTRERIQRTLEEKPWKSCGCSICETWGIEVVIFRGNNRNRRRGFHNTYVLYRQLQETFAQPEPDPFDSQEADSLDVPSSQMVLW